MGGSLGTRHSRVIGKIGAEHRVDYGTAARVTTPLALASDTGGFASAQAPRQAFACHRRLHQMALAHLRSGLTCPQGSTGTAPRAVPPLASRVSGLALPWRAGPVDSVDS